MNNSDERQPLTEADRQVFHELYEEHHQRVYSNCLRLTHDVSEAEDLTQDSLVSKDWKLSWRISLHNLAPSSNCQSRADAFSKAKSAI